ncbi:MAG: hypothetical protein AAGE37_12130 [Pseudomonadota bacterium]
MMGFLGGLVGIFIMFALGSVAANFVIHVLRPQWSSKKHILWCSMLPPAALWLLVTIVTLFSGFESFSAFVLMPSIVLAIVLPFFGALVGIPVSWFVVKIMKWKKSEPLDDVFK